MNVIAQAAQSAINALVEFSQIPVVQQFYSVADQLSWLVFPVAGVVIAGLILVEMNGGMVEESH